MTKMCSSMHIVQMSLMGHVSKIQFCDSCLIMSNLTVYLAKMLLKAKREMFRTFYSGRCSGQF